MPLPPITLTGTYFSANNRRFIPVGAHWIPAKAALQWPHQWDETEIDADFAKMRELGFNTVRFDLFWAWVEPHPGIYNPEAFKQLDFFIQLAHRYDIYLHPTFFVGGEVGEAFWDVPWRQGRHPHADADLLRLQTNHAAEFAKRYRAEPAILAWDLTDEPPYWIVADQTTDAMAVNWTRLLAGALRRYDPTHVLCVGTSMEDVHRGPFRPDIIADEVDFLSAHPYSIYTLDRFPDPMLSERGTYCGAFQTALSSGAGKPVMIHEFGASSAQYGPERIAHCDRITMYSSLAAGANGFLAWCYTDAAPDTFKRVPYLRAPHETQFGLTTWDRQDRPRGQVMRDFSKVVAQLDLNAVEPAPADAALIVPHEWGKPHGDMAGFGLTTPNVIPYSSTQDRFDTHADNVWITGAWLSAFVLARRAGLKPDMPREHDDWQSRPLVLLPSPLTATERNITHVHTDFWDSARAYVQNGGILYASLCADAAIPEMGDLFGATLCDHTSADDVTLTIVSPFGDLPVGTVFRYRADSHNPRHWPATLDLTGGQVIAQDQDGRPALIAHSSGKGKTLLSAYPIESYLAVTPSAFEGDEKTYLLYRALCQWAELTPRFSTDHPSVEVSALIGEKRGYAVLANHRAESVTVTVTSREALRSVSLITSNGAQPLAISGNTWQMEMDGYGGTIVEYLL